MLNFSPAKVTLILLVCLYGALAALPNFLGEDRRAALPAFLPSSTLSLGLDLQGGVHLLLEAQTEDVVESRLKNLAGAVRDIRRRERDLNFRNIRISGRSIIFDVSRDDMVDRAREELRQLTQSGQTLSPFGTPVQEVSLDRDGNRFTLALTDEGVIQQQRDAVARAIEVVRRRIDPDGTREIIVRPQGADRIILQVPGEDDPTELIRLINRAAVLTFHDVDTAVSGADIQRGRIGAGRTIVSSDNGLTLVIYDRSIVSGADLTNAQASFDSGGQPAVAFTFNTAGARRFANHTRENVNRPFAIMLDGKLISAPNIQSPILGGSGIISGVGSTADAQELATLLAAGALPVPLTVLEQRTVGPDLGADSIEAGKWASAIGFVGVIIYMLMSYGGFGLAANISLIINLVLIMGALSLFQATLTLPGIAGIVLTIGMAVDANVLVFERVREEQRQGKKPFAALEQGYAQAFSTILDANITTFIAAAILYALGSGPVQGFAVTLAIGILTSMFTAIVVSRMLLALWLHRAKPETLPI